MDREKERDGIGCDLKMYAMEKREERGGMELWFARGRQAGELPFLPAVSEVMWSGRLSCFHMPNPRHLPLVALGTGVGGVDLYPGGRATAKGDC